jgi:Tol biopolymer transport system component
LAAGALAGAAAAVPARETTRVISSRAQLAAIAARGGPVHVLPTGGSYFFLSPPRLSRGGGLVAYGGQRCPNCATKLTVLPTRGGPPRSLRRAATDPAWAPDGRRLVFVAITPHARAGLPLYMIHSSGAGLRKLDVEIRESSGDEHELQLFHNPVFAPSGTAIAFDAEVDEEEQVFLFDLKTHVARQLSHNPHGAAEPAFTPDGRKIVYACADAKGSRDICIVSTDSVYGQRLIATAGDDGDPAVSPNGRTIVFSTDLPNRRAGFRSLYVAPLAGGTPRRLTRGFNASDPTFTPNGRRIVFVRRVFVRTHR